MRRYTTWPWAREMSEIAFAAHTDTFGCFPSATCPHTFDKSGHPFSESLRGSDRKSIRMAPFTENP